MAAPYVHQPAPPKHPYQDSYVAAVISGDLKNFKELRVPTRDISRQLFLPDSTRPKLKYTKRGRPIMIRRPTLLQLAVVCEQDEIIRYILDYKEPDLSAKSGDGRNVLHVAAAVKDYRPLQILLEYQWIQEHIDEQLNLPGQPPRDGFFNTALHVAVTSRNIPHVFLLISELPPLHVLPRGPKVEGEEQAPLERYNPANFDQRSAGGSVPLHIAVQQQNLSIVRILCVSGADASIQNDYGQTPLALGQEMKKARDDDLEVRRKKFETDGRPYVPPDAKSDIDEIVKVLQSPPDESLEELRQTLAPYLVPKVEIHGGGGLEDEEGDEIVKGKGGAKMNELLDFVRGMDRRLKALEARAGTIPTATAVTVAPGTVCTVCQGPGEPCGQCRVPFCSVCADKPSHTCTG
jgi:hypothetical protein